MRVPFTNDSDKPVTIGLKTIGPGETKTVDETLVPDFKKEPAGEAPVVDPILEILDDSIANIVPKLPDLSDEDFEKVQLAEQKGKTRAGLEKAFAEEKVRRAAAATDAANAGNSGDDSTEPKGDE